MRPFEVHWLVEAKIEEIEAQKKASGQLTERDYAELYELAFGDQ